MEGQCQAERLGVCNLIVSTQEPHYNQTNFTHKNGNIWLGSQNAIKQNYLKEINVGAVLSIMDSYMMQSSKVKQRVNKIGIKHHEWFELDDHQDQDISVFFDKSFEFLTQKLKETNVLVHCWAGISRSATLVIAFIMKKYSLPLKTTQQLVTNKRYCVRPNDGFLKSLQKLQKQLQSNLTGKDKQNKIKQAPYRHCHQIINVISDDERYGFKGNIYLGGVKSFNEQVVKEGKIGAVLTVLDSYHIKHQMIRQLVFDNGITKECHKQVAIDDNEDVNIKQYFDSCYEFIYNNLQERNVLVHCHGGISRSAAMVIAFIMRHLGIDYNEAYDKVKERRQIIRPNDGFIRQLKEYEKELKAKL